MRTHIDLRLIDGDLLTTAAALVCFKHAQSFYGVDAEAVRRLTAGGRHAEHAFEVAAGDARVVDSGGALAAPRAAFLGTARLGELRYHELRLLATRMLTLAQGERVATLATTVHGVRAGLDEAEAVLALVGGFVDAFQRGLGGDVAEVIIVENNPARARRMREALASGLASTAGVVAQPGGGFRVERSPGFQQAPRLATAGVSSQSKPHAFVAMPFAAELDDVFHYGIARPVADAGLLCERVDQDTFSGLIIERIRERIDSARVVIADLSLANPNVYLEVGYAWGRGRPTILLVRDVKDLRFDVQGYRCLVYQNIRQLEQQLTAELGRLPPLAPGATHGP
ncbi:MAG: hypothetical protein IPL61_34470 [Myxococcales bacterium]|nr:hypothetical protein [Myxococcales bacterium]